MHNFSQGAPTPVWVDITPSDMCQSIGVLEYTATLTNVPEDLDHPRKGASGSLQMDGRFDESDCIPMCSSITSEKCIGPGVRPYYADLAYVPPGLDKLSSCQATPATIHRRETLSMRCELLLDRGRRDHDEQGHDWNETLIARGEWDIDFDEDSCVPRGSEPITPHECLSFGTQHYSSNLIVPRGLERMALTLAREIPAMIHDRHILANCYERLDQDGIQTVRGHLNISFSEPSYKQCHAYDKKYTAFLKDVPRELNPLKTCNEAPLDIDSS
ncbi:hypothetical protein K435DRAFT_879528 [Dendrothele bispora CBS 962.96]|uniref:Uncharacterized protein n=1 Tax=Dendrothele bispora (strain CBS 962.96) TaxID=1314807 RepID=A0A4S8KL24_DENBC|nr:hypothetical protein K435DRAFT_879528 [Dendrothele bispora CBS 962.96]